MKFIVKSKYCRLLVLELLTIISLSTSTTSINMITSATQQTVYVRPVQPMDTQIRRLKSVSPQMDDEKILFITRDDNDPNYTHLPEVLLSELAEGPTIGLNNQLPPVASKESMLHGKLYDKKQLISTPLPTTDENKTSIGTKFSQLIGRAAIVPLGRPPADYYFPDHLNIGRRSVGQSSTTTAKPIYDQIPRPIIFEDDFPL